MATETKRDKVKAKAKARLSELPFSRVIPNITTLLALCIGLSSIRFVLAERYEIAIIAILIAGMLDAMDGPLARMLGVSSHFGAELDSFSDLINFGVSPAVIIYISALHQWKGFGWAIALLYVICATLRLARFNTDLLETDTKKDWEKKFFRGVPMPAGAFLALLPMMISFATGTKFYEEAWICAPMLVLVGALFVSRIPTYALKGRKINAENLLYVMLAGGIAITALINAFWYALSCIGLGYLLTLPFSYRSYNRIAAQETGK